MPIYQAIQTLKNTAPLTILDAERFMSNLTPKLQMQIIAAIYIGRNHIHAKTWNEDVMLSTDYIDDIQPESFARIIAEKNTALVSYLEGLERCASNTNFDLNTL